MTASNQMQLLQQINRSLKDARLAAAQLRGGRPLITKITDAIELADAWKSIQAAGIPEDWQSTCFGVDAPPPARTIDLAQETV